MHKVYYFSTDDNDWIQHSKHKNLEWAEIQYDLLDKKGLVAKVTKYGKIVLSNENKLK
jgi:hypothetical protein